MGVGAVQNHCRLKDSFGMAPLPEYMIPVSGRVGKTQADTFFCLQSYCDNPDLVLDLKNLIVLFADTLQVGFCVINALN